jgi:hypothetical protein
MTVIVVVAPGRGIAIGQTCGTYMRYSSSETAGLAVENYGDRG